MRKPVRIDVFQQSIGRRVVGERLVARFKNAKAAFRWNGRANRKGQKVRDGIFMVRFRLKVSNGLIDNRRIDRSASRAASPSARRTTGARAAR